MILFDLTFKNRNCIKSHRWCTIKLSQRLNRFQHFYRILRFLSLVALAHTTHLPLWIDNSMIFKYFCFVCLRFCIVQSLFFGFIHDLMVTFWNFNCSISFLCSRNWSSLVDFLRSLSLNGYIYFFWSWLLNGTLWMIVFIVLALILVCYGSFIICQRVAWCFIFRSVVHFWTDNWSTFVEGDICARVLRIVLSIMQRLVFLSLNRFVHRFKALNFDYFYWFFFHLFYR